LIRTGQFEKATSSLDAAFEREGSNSKGLAYQVEAYLGLGDLDRASQSYGELESADSTKAHGLLQHLDSSVKNGILHEDARLRSWLESHSQSGVSTSS